MPAQLIDGKQIAAAVRAEVRAGVDARHDARHRAPVLRVVLVGKHPASASYVRGKIKAAADAEIDSETLPQPESIAQAELLSLIDQLNRDPAVDGILVQLGAQVADSCVAGGRHPGSAVARSFERTLGTPSP